MNGRVKFKSLEEGMFVEVTTETGEKIWAEDLQIGWDPQRGLYATIVVPLPEIDLEIRRENISVINDVEFIREEREKRAQEIKKLLAEKMAERDQE